MNADPEEIHSVPEWLSFMRRIPHTNEAFRLGRVFSMAARLLIRLSLPFELVEQDSRG